MNSSIDTSATRDALEKCKQEYQEKFRDLLVERVGFPAYQKVLSSVAPEEKIENVSLDEIMRIVREFRATVNGESEAYRREGFVRRYQRQNESIRDYLTSLRDLIRGCGFLLNEEERLRDQLIFGFKDVNMKALALTHYANLCSRSCDDIVAILENHFNPKDAPPIEAPPLPPREDPARPRATLPMPVMTPVQMSSVVPSGGQIQIGIEGRHNSCYMDAALMALFLFDTSFNGCLNFDHAAWGNGNHQQYQSYGDPKNVLITQVIGPLQRDKKLPIISGAMQNLRTAMASLKPGFLSAQMDAEDFVSTLFNDVLHSNHFYKIDGNGAGFVLQTFADVTKPTGQIVSVQTLLEYTFHISQIRLDEVPNPGFIVKLPVSNGKPVFEKVLPNLEISLGNILLKNFANPKMLLSAVICLENNHYTVFVRTGQGKYATWMHIDSLVYPRFHEVSGLSLVLESIGNNVSPSIHLEEDKLKILYLLKAAYMCIYLPKA